VLAHTVAVGHTSICEFVCVLIYIVNVVLFGEVPVIPSATVYMLHKIFDCPSCASSADVCVRKCHEILLGRGLSHGPQRLLLYEESLLLRSHEMI